MLSQNKNKVPDEYRDDPELWYAIQASMQFEEGNQEEIPSGSRQRNYSNERDKNDDDELFRDVDDL